MDVKVRKIETTQKELVEISCHELTDSVREIVFFIKSRQGQLSGILDGKQFEIPVGDILYVEAVDNRVFLYTLNKTYETKQKLYELEEGLVQKEFLRISKSTILNLLKVRALKPGMNGRFVALLKNGEEVMISRKYVPDLKKRLKGEIL